jgi:hypothetical protein
MSHDAHSPVHAADVEDHGVIGFRVAEEVPFLAVERVVDDVATVAQRLADLLVQVAVVLDHQNAHPDPLAAA